MLEFREFGKIARLSRECVVTEKIDGTNGLVTFDENMEMYVGSRRRWITPENDNYGFAKWAFEHKEELKSLGVGFHYGEWWGQGVQRKYGLDEKRWSLFNVGRWGVGGKDELLVPKCCHVVPVLYRGMFDTNAIADVMEKLKNDSVAAPGFANPEGVVIYHVHGGYSFKKTFEKDEAGKCQ